MSECCVVVIDVVQFGTMVGKVAVTQTLVRGTQWDFNMAFLVIVTKRVVDSSSSISGGGAVSWITIEPHSFEHNKFVFKM